jgi:predicted HAD superfamily Cof-like phosphohydrolase
MNTWQEAVLDFHEGTNQPVGTSPALRDRELRAKLIMEEAVETVAALGYSVTALIDEEGIIGETPHREIARFAKRYREPHFLDAIDGFCDLIYVTLGAAVAAGIDLDPFFWEVQRANLDKLNGPVREDGKQLKPEGWRGPEHEPILAKQVAYAAFWQDAQPGENLEIAA